jgi:hypothetical protein
MLARKVKTELRIKFESCVAIIPKSVEFKPSVILELCLANT